MLSPDKKDCDSLFIIILSPSDDAIEKCIQLDTLVTQRLIDRRLTCLSSTFYISINNIRTAVAQWLRCCATNRKVAGSIPAGISGFFVDIISFRTHCGPRVDSASNRNEYQEYFLGLKSAGA